MPKKLEKELEKEARKLGYRKNSKEWNRYVYGTMRKLGWKPKRETN